ncbi:MAG: hypothetical protein H7A05_02535 [Pseudomonadales bacterium]|nr:hypothetical protein [Pseudomonadales bacterium]MCP5331011.1 hypothetical protein [Pseudomonadales bacterium]MCP5343473.1 hypothetical protein [Pseudomonadales bacterium]
MSSLRKQDRSGTMVFERTERIFDDGGLWYFRTREAGIIGPFRYESEARQMLDHFLSELQATAKAVAYAEKLHLRRSAIASIAGQVMTPLGVSH